MVRIIVRIMRKNYGKNYEEELYGIMELWNYETMGL